VFLRALCSEQHGLKDVFNFDLRPPLLKILGYEAAMAMFGSRFAAQEAAPVDGVPL
jgi:hypothetical protein